MRWLIPHGAHTLAGSPEVLSEHLAQRTRHAIQSARQCSHNFSTITRNRPYRNSSAITADRHARYLVGEARVEELACGCDGPCGGGRSAQARLRVGCVAPQHGACVIGVIDSCEWTLTRMYACVCVCVWDA